MADPSCRNVDIFEDDDPTEELQILPGGKLKPAEDSPAADTDSAANQSFANEGLEVELRDADKRVSSLSSELHKRAEEMKSLLRELDDLQEFSAFLVKEVDTGKDAISRVTDELVSVRSQQNDASQELQRREQEIAALQDKIARKDAVIDEFSRQVGSVTPHEKVALPDSQRANDDDQSELANGKGDAIRHDGHAPANRLRMLVGKYDDKAKACPILPGGISLGTGSENDVQLQDPFVSYRHARITETAAGCVLKDLGSSNGTWINQRRIQWQVLQDGDLIDIGPLRFEFVDRPAEIEDELDEGEADK
jgi:pSer/pThr/pTyr-binding forkhead associated (FHA) protein